MVVYSKVTVALTCFSAIASAAAVPVKSPRKGFTVNQVNKTPTGTRTVNLPAVYANALAKYGATVPTHVQAAASSGSAITTPEEGDIEYLTPVTIGESTLNLDFDTGSADLWVFSSDLSASEQKGHDIYDVSSSGQKLAGSSWSISYGDGSSASGDVYKDTVSVGGVKATSQAVEAAKKISSQFLQDKNNDGLLGLAFSSINTVSPRPQKTFFDNVKSELDSPLFAVTLKHGAPGTYDFGFIDKEKFTGEVVYADVDSSQGFWTFTADSYKVGNGAAGPSINGIADTGTTLLLVDDDIVSAYYKKVTGAKDNTSVGGYVFPCDTNLPDFTVTINGYDAVVPGKHINYAPVSTGSSSCFGGIQSNSGIGFSIFGDIFLKSQYVVFDAEGPRLGFAAQA
ncbi:Peptidase aspartic catalytic [Penicillium cf. griseofulvum]|uniref:penicillopepsin n=1 Tax=Penicillium cf. griseofulvum TaxID=2972120 RepID=A0A9W9MEM1_9EURO|nr:Peptidase aspartic catalytic [Penicillium cf. griseofulvum]KAJ5423677.1 Peptidase aspartic catalytic [Penicillium cf. griseofulvum]KAJ5431070.1 Peptidase aspartic catalytic [Penicillium cf. griseofulvum]